MKFNITKKWKVKLIMSVLVLLLSALGYNLTPQQKAVLAPVAGVLVESVTHDDTTSQSDIVMPSIPFIEPEPKPPKVEGLVNDVVEELVEDAASSLVESFFN
ncbi:MAG: hypothetical protein RPT25_06665 [Cycloclasticus sp.]|jgi:hypothetical protein